MEKGREQDPLVNLWQHEVTVKKNSYHFLTVKATGTKLASEVLYNRMVISEQKECPAQKSYLLTSSWTLSKLELWLKLWPKADTQQV